VVYPKFRVTSEIMPRAVGALMFYMRSLLKISDVVFANKIVKKHENKTEINNRKTQFG
jgi:hypothetical protein